jgi:hypothetical protein
MSHSNERRALVCRGSGNLDHRLARSHIQKGDRSLRIGQAGQRRQTQALSGHRKGAHPRAVDRPGAATDAAAAVLPVAADTAMCLLAPDSR